MMMMVMVVMVMMVIKGYSPTKYHCLTKDQQQKQLVSIEPRNHSSVAVVIQQRIPHFHQTFHFLLFTFYFNFYFFISIFTFYFLLFIFYFNFYFRI